MDKSIINFRNVFTGGICAEWIPMPEISNATLKGLTEYLEICPGWNYRQLNTMYGAAWEKHIIGYNTRGQFWLPEIPDKTEFTWIVEDAILTDYLNVCRVCGKTPRIDPHYITMAGSVERTIIKCNCGMTLGVFEPIFMVPLDAVNRWNDLNLQGSYVL